MYQKYFNMCKIYVLFCFFVLFLSKIIRHSIKEYYIATKTCNVWIKKYISQSTCSGDILANYNDKKVIHMEDFSGVNLRKQAF